MFAARLAGLLTALLWLAAPAQAAPPNFLFVVVDDLNCDVRCYARGTARTPHLDAIASAGVRFERAYAQVPSCNGSRASLSELAGAPAPPQLDGQNLVPLLKEPSAAWRHSGSASRRCAGWSTRRRSLLVDVAP